MSRALPASLALLLLLGCGAGGETGPEGQDSSAGAPGGSQKADDPHLSDPAEQAPRWLLSHAGSGTWEEEPGEGEVTHKVQHAWVDAKVQNRRPHKRVFVEVAAPYGGEVVMRTLHPAAFKAGLGDGYERWGSDALEIYPEGGPHGAHLSAPVMYRLRMQEDPDGSGRERMVVTGWEALYGEGAAWIPSDEVWGTGWRSPARGEAVMDVPELSFTPFDDAGAVVTREIDAVIAAEQETPEERHTIHAAVFNINDPRIVDRLIEAHRAGVEVRLITEASKLSPIQHWQTEDDRLLEAGVPLLGVGRMGRGAMHDKLALFDGRRLSTGSFNWEVGSSTENHEDMLLTDRPELVAAYARRFEVVAGQVQGPREHAADPEAEVSVSFAPDEAPHVIMGRLIDKARHTVYSAMFTCKDVEYEEDGKKTSLFEKLGAAVDRGVDVRVITDFGIAEASEYYGVFSEDDPKDEELEAMGVHVVRADNPLGRYASMHHKFSVLDREVAVIGAFNWYWDAAYLNDEDQVVWRDELVAAELLGEFAEMTRRYDEAWDPAEWPQVAVTFSVEHGGTGWGDSLLLVGDLPELGAWDPASGLDLSSSDWPVWAVTVSLPAGTRLEYKPVLRRADGSLSWAEGPNRKLRVPTGVETHVLISRF